MTIPPADLGDGATLRRLTLEDLDGIWTTVERRYAGGAGLRPDPLAIAGDVGYWVAAEHEGRGYVTRAVSVLINVGFDELELRRIVIRAGVENRRSRAIPERLGSTSEGVARGTGRGRDGFYDLVVYSILRDEWPGS